MSDLLLKLIGVIGCRALAIFMVCYGTFMAYLVIAAFINIIKRNETLINLLYFGYLICISYLNYIALDMHKLMISEKASISVMLVLFASLFIFKPIGREILKKW